MCRRRGPVVFERLPPMSAPPTSRAFAGAAIADLDTTYDVTVHVQTCVRGLARCNSCWLCLLPPRRIAGALKYVELQRTDVAMTVMTITYGRVPAEFAVYRVVGAQRRRPWGRSAQCRSAEL